MPYSHSLAAAFVSLPNLRHQALPNDGRKIPPPTGDAETPPRAAPQGPGPGAHSDTSTHVQPRSGRPPRHPAVWRASPPGANGSCQGRTRRGQRAQISTAEKGKVDVSVNTLHRTFGGIPVCSDHPFVKVDLPPPAPATPEQRVERLDGRAAARGGLRRSPPARTPPPPRCQQCAAVDRWAASPRPVPAAGRTAAACRPGSSTSWTSSACSSCRTASP